MSLLGPDEMLDRAIARNVELRQGLKDAIAAAHQAGEGHGHDGWKRCDHPLCRRAAELLAEGVCETCGKGLIHIRPDKPLIRRCRECFERVE